MADECSAIAYNLAVARGARSEPRIKAICETRIRYGYRRVHVMLQREGSDINIK